MVNATGELSTEYSRVVGQRLPSRLNGATESEAARLLDGTFSLSTAMLRLLENAAPKACGLAHRGHKVSTFVYFFRSGWTSRPLPLARRERRPDGGEKRGLKKPTGLSLQDSVTGPRALPAVPARDMSGTGVPDPDPVKPYGEAT